MSHHDINLPLDNETYLKFKPEPSEINHFLNEFDFFYDTRRILLDGKIMFNDGSYLNRETSNGHQWWILECSNMPSSCKR